MYSDLTVDYLKVTLLNAPAVLLVCSPARASRLQLYQYFELLAARLRDSMW